MNKKYMHFKIIPAKINFLQLFYNEKVTYFMHVMFHYLIHHHTLSPSWKILNRMVECNWLGKNTEIYYVNKHIYGDLGYM